jgi:hypothetical protein
MNDSDVYGSPQDYDALIAVFVRRAADLGISHAALDDLAGLADGFIGKALGPSKVKRLGPMSLFAVLPALGLKITLVEDPDALRRYGGRARRRQGRQARMGNFAQRAGKRVVERTTRYLAGCSWSEILKTVSAAKQKIAAEQAAKAAVEANKQPRRGARQQNGNGTASAYDAPIGDELEEIAEASSIRVSRDDGERRGRKRGRVSAPFPSPMDQHAINRRTQARILSMHAKPRVVVSLNKAGL